MGADEPGVRKDAETIVDDDLVAFFDFLAQYDYEDKEAGRSALKTDPRMSAPEGQF